MYNYVNDCHIHILENALNHFLQEVITPLVRLSKNLQKVGLTIADANRHIEATKTQLTVVR